MHKIVARWWNWQTRWTQNPVEVKLRESSSLSRATSKLMFIMEATKAGQNPVRVKSRVGSTPTLGTKINTRYLMRKICLL